MEPKLLDRPNRREILVDIKRIDDVKQLTCSSYARSTSALRSLQLMEAILGKQTAFARTPKYAVGAHKTKLQKRKVPPPQWLAAVRGDGGRNVLRAHDRLLHRYLELSRDPFLLLFVAGYYWAGFFTLHQEYQEKMDWLRQRRLEALREQVQ